MWQRYAGSHHPHFVRLPVSAFRRYVAKAIQKQRPMEDPIKQSYLAFGIDDGLLVSRNTVTELANACLHDASHKRGKFMGKKPKMNNDGMHRPLTIA